jgi:hypothetical protein
VWPAQPLQVVQAVGIGAEPGLELAYRARIVQPTTDLSHGLSLLRLNGEPKSGLSPGPGCRRRPPLSVAPRARVTREKGMIMGERRYVEQGCGAAPSRIAPGEVQPDYGGSSGPVCPVPCVGRPGQHPGYLLDSQRAGVGVWPVRHDCAVVVLRVRRRVLSGGAGEVPATAKAGGGAAGCAATRRRSGSYSPAGEGKFFFTMIGRVRPAGARHHPSAHHGRAGRAAGAGPHPRTAGRDGRR